MKRQTKVTNPTKKTPAADRRGALLPLIAITLIILFVACVIAIDIARIHVTRSELRTATDAAARAAIEALGREQDTQAAIDAAIAIAQQNRVAGNGLDLEPSNILFGTSTEQADGTFLFSQNGAVINSVQIVGERTAGSPDGAVHTLFGGLFGADSFEPIQTAVATRLDRDIALVLDVSGSMGSNGRFNGLQNALDVFLDMLEETPQEERVSLTVYESDSRKKVSLTGNLELISEAFEDESPDGSTAIGRGLQTGLDSIQNDPGRREFALRSIIVMTDGNHNTGISPDIVARDECAPDGITVHTITLGNNADEDLMEDVADETGGLYLHARNNAELTTAFETIANTIQVLLTK